MIWILTCFLRALCGRSNSGGCEHITYTAMCYNLGAYTVMPTKKKKKKRFARDWIFGINVMLIQIPGRTCDITVTLIGSSITCTEHTDCRLVLYNFVSEIMFLSTPEILVILKGFNQQLNNDEQERCLQLSYTSLYYMSK